jgi:hypothetical protein
VKAIVNPKILNDNSEFIIEHNGEELHFSFKVFTRTSGIREPNYIQELPLYLNQYWSYLPPEKQSAIFEHYRNIFKYFNDNHDKRTFLELASQEIAELLNHHSIADIYSWIVFHSTINPPANFLNEFVLDINTNNTREKTYTRKDYLELMALAIALRTIVPIWGEFMYYYKDELGTNFKEIQSFKLLDKSELANSDPVSKLKTYIENIVGDAKYELVSTTSGISSEDYFNYLLALVCIRRISIENISHESTDKNLVICIYSYINSKLNNINSGGINEIIDKSKQNNSASNDINHISILERYRIKTPISPGETTEIKYILQNPIRHAIKLTYGNIDQSLLDRSVETAIVLKDYPIEDPQVMMLQYIFKPIVSPRGIPYLDKISLAGALGACEAILYARGFKYLATLVSAHEFISTDGAMHATRDESKLRVPEELVDEINRLYPFSIQQALKKNNNKPINTVEKTINSIVDKLSHKAWEATCHADILQEVFGTVSRKIPIKHDLRIEMYKFIISIATENGMF